MEQSADYLQGAALVLTEASLGVYCSTKNFTYALIYQLKASRALDLADIPQAIHLGRLGVEMAYLAYFASDGFSYLGPKWLALTGHARGAGERLKRHPLLREGIQLLFPACGSSPTEPTICLQAVARFLTSMRELIEQRRCSGSHSAPARRFIPPSSARSCNYH